MCVCITRKCYRFYRHLTCIRFKRIFPRAFAARRSISRTVIIIRTGGRTLAPRKHINPKFSKTTKCSRLLRTSVLFRSCVRLEVFLARYFFPSFFYDRHRANAVFTTVFALRAPAAYARKRRAKVFFFLPRTDGRTDTRSRYRGSPVSVVVIGAA